MAQAERGGVGAGKGSRHPTCGHRPEGSDGTSGERHLANRLLAALPPADFEIIRPDLRIVELRQGETLYEPGQPVPFAYFPHGSMISLLAVLEEGATAEVAVFGREGVAGFATTLVGEYAFGRYVVQIPGTASMIGNPRLLQAVQSRPTIRDLLARYSEALLSQTFQTVACNTLHSVEARCCRWILGTCDRAGQDKLALTHDFLAEMLGVQRPTVSLIARNLQAAGLIRQGRGVIEVIDREKLEENACCCYRLNRRNFERLLPGIFTE